MLSLKNPSSLNTQFHPLRLTALSFLFCPTIACDWLIKLTQLALTNHRQDTFFLTKQVRSETSCESKVVYHFPENSGNFGWNVNERRNVFLSERKFSCENGIS